MKKKKIISTAIRLLVTSFLFLSFISSSFNLTSSDKSSYTFFAVKKVKGPVHPDTGFPIGDSMEEPESRGEDKHEEHTLLFQQLYSLIATSSVPSLDWYTDEIKTTPGAIPGVPVYIANRILLI